MYQQNSYQSVWKTATKAAVMALVSGFLIMAVSVSAQETSDNAVSKSQVKAQQERAQQWLDIAGAELKQHMYETALKALKDAEAFKESLTSKQQSLLSRYESTAKSGIEAQANVAVVLEVADDLVKNGKYEDAAAMIAKANDYRNYLTDATGKRIDELMQTVVTSQKAQKAAMIKVYKQSKDYYKNGQFEEAKIGFGDVVKSGVRLSAFDMGDFTSAEGYLARIDAAAVKAQEKEARLAQEALAAAEKQAQAEAKARTAAPAVETPSEEETVVEQAHPQPVMPAPVAAAVKPVNEPKPVPAVVTPERKKGQDLTAEQLQSIKNLLSQADLAMTRANYEQAKLYFNEVLVIDAANQVAQNGVTAANVMMAQPREPRPQGTPSILDRYNLSQELQVKAVEAEWLSAKSRIDNLRGLKQFENAISLTNQSLSRFEAARQVLGPDRFVNMKNEATGIMENLEKEQKQARESILAEQIARSEQEERDRLARDRNERDRKVKELFELAEKARGNQEYENGIATLERLLLIDPTNQEAQSLKRALEDLKFLSDQVAIARRADREEQKVLVEAQEASTPYSDRYRFPEKEEWDRITRLRKQPDTEKAVRKEEVMKILNEKKLNLTVTDYELQEVVRTISTETGINIVVLWNDLNEAGIMLDDLVTVQLVDVPAGKALDRVLEYVSGGKYGRAGYDVDEEGIVSVRQVSDTYGYTLRTYYVADLIESSNMGMMGGGMGGMGGGMGGMGGGMGGMSGNNRSNYGGGSGSSRSNYGGGSGSSRSNYGGGGGRNFYQTEPTFTPVDPQMTTPQQVMPGNEVDNISYDNYNIGAKQSKQQAQPANPNDLRVVETQFGMGGMGGGMMGGMGGMGGGMMGGRGGMGGGMMGGMGGMGGGMMGGMGGGMMGGMGGMMGGMGGGNFYEQSQLQYLIMSTIEPDTWMGMGGMNNQRGGMGGMGGLQGQQGQTVTSTSAMGRGNIMFYKNSWMNVFQTARVHKQIDELLAKLRTTIGDQVAIEARFLQISNNFIEDIGMDVDFLVNMGNAGFNNPNFTDISGTQDSLGFTSPPPQTTVPGSLGGAGAPTAFTLSGSFLDNVQVDFLLRATQAHSRNRTLVAPHVTVFNGEPALVSFRTDTNYVRGATPVVGYGIGLYELEIDTDSSGIELYVTPVISKDKRYVQLNVNFSQEITRAIQTFNSATGAEAPTSDQPIFDAPTVTIQEPIKDINEVTTHVSVPDGGTLLLGGQKMIGEAERESGIPGLSKLPIINRLFSNRSSVQDESVLLILLKPKIILQSEEEEVRFGTMVTEK